MVDVAKSLAVVDVWKVESHARIVSAKEEKTVEVMEFVHRQVWRLIKVMWPFVYPGRFTDHREHFQRHQGAR